jgi:hypothetical protein
MNGLDKDDWTLLLSHIRDKKCTPIVGSGACIGGPPVGVNENQWKKFKYPIGEDLAEELAKEFEYPFEDSGRLGPVAQFVGVEHGWRIPKDRIADRLKSGSVPDFRFENEPHRVLAELALPVYITSNFDDYLLRALKREEKGVHISLCRWNKHIPRDAPAFNPDPAERDQISYCKVEEDGAPPTLIYTRPTDAVYKPEPANPLVYYFHGHLAWPASLVVTEDDYFEFLLNLSKASPSLIMPRVQQVFGDGSLLFLGYKLTDWDFLVLFRLLTDSLKGGGFKHVAVQLGPSQLAGKAADAIRAEKAAKYFREYYGTRNIKVFWGTCQEFIAELKRRRG